MPHKPKALVLDSWSVIAYLEDEPAGQQIAQLISNAHASEIPVMMTVANAGEVWYIIAREISEEEANGSIKQLRDLRIQFVEVDWDITLIAARLKANNKMSYADCYAAALAKHNKADLITGDKEFKSVEDQISILWV